MTDRRWVAASWAIAASLFLTAILRGSGSYYAGVVGAAVYILLVVVTALLSEFSIALVVALCASIEFFVFPPVSRLHRIYGHSWRGALAVAGISLLAGGVALLVRKRLVRGEVYSRWQEVIERAAWGAAIEDPKTHIFRNVNPTFAHMHGYTVEELIGQPCTSVVAPENQADAAAHSHILQENCHTVYEAIHIRKDGSRFPVLTDVTAYTDESNSVTFLAATYQDISDRRRMEESLQHTRLELEKRLDQRTLALHRMSRRLQRVQDEARRKFARELHDSTGQHLVGLKMNLEILRALSADTRQRELVEDSLNITDRCISEVRTLSYVLHPPLLDEMGLAPAIRWFVDGFSSRSGIDVKLDIPSNLSELATETELVLFRVIQECLTNIHRHSGSKLAEIVLVQRDHKIIMEVRDYGRGIPTAQIDEHLNPLSPMTVGLPGMKERITELEGQMEIISGPLGTTIRATLPLRTPLDNAA
jgi:PAS domain S-box-containing protein